MGGRVGKQRASALLTNEHYTPLLEHCGPTVTDRQSVDALCLTGRFASYKAASLRAGYGGCEKNTMQTPVSCTYAIGIWLKKKLAVTNTATLAACRLPVHLNPPLPFFFSMLFPAWWPVRMAPSMKTPIGCRCHGQLC